QCSNCQATSTPLWRRSAKDELLCNACGLYHRSDDGSSRNNERVDKMSESSCHPTTRGTTHYRPPNMQCSNCGTCTTPLWRRDTDGSSLCNACGLYLKLHNEKRPLSMKTDHFKKRQR
ncbi:hypothetical protein BDF20DRAFT_795199, partial [Mycotypha africana]|uniref:uncharacterized protein n=1 Tax=Mycotypha africana TaxID=64632 RepID=UPI0023014148